MRTPNVLHLLYTGMYTQFCRIRDGGGAGRLPPPPPDNFWRTELTRNKLDIIGTGIYQRLRFILDIEKYSDFATLCEIFAKYSAMASEWLSEKISSFLKYKHIMCSFEARNLDISNMQLLSRNM